MNKQLILKALRVGLRYVYKGGEDQEKIEAAIAAVQAMPDDSQPATIASYDAVEAFEAGWKLCAAWAKRPDLLADMHSPAYRKERAEALANLPASDDAQDAKRQPCIPDGWVFYTADFSIQADRPHRKGNVMLRRDVAGLKAWIALSDEDRERVALYVTGVGKTLDDALRAAIDSATKENSNA